MPSEESKVADIEHRVAVLEHCLCERLCALERRVKRLEQFRRFAFQYAAVAPLLVDPELTLCFAGTLSEPPLQLRDPARNPVRVTDESEGAFEPSTGALTVPSAGLWRFDASALLIDFNQFSAPNEIGSALQLRILVDGVAQESTGYTEAPDVEVGDDVGPFAPARIQGDYTDASAISVLLRLRKGRRVTLQAVSGLSGIQPPAQPSLLLKYSFSGCRVGK